MGKRLRMVAAPAGAFALAAACFLIVLFAVLVPGSTNGHSLGGGPVGTRPPAQWAQRDNSTGPPNAGAVPGPSGSSRQEGGVPVDAGLFQKGSCVLFRPHPRRPAPDGVPRRRPRRHRPGSRRSNRGRANRRRGGPDPGGGAGRRRVAQGARVRCGRIADTRLTGRSPGSSGFRRWLTDAAGRARRHSREGRVCRSGPGGGAGGYLL